MIQVDRVLNGIHLKTFTVIQVDRVLNGISRPLWGSLSDVIGRERALGTALALQAVVLLTWSTCLAKPAAFIALSSLSTFSWGEVYSLVSLLLRLERGTRRPRMLSPLPSHPLATLRPILKYPWFDPYCGAVPRPRS